ncbi:MAG: HD domain-containing protein, partial [Bacilli bacterium]|nr:HD domain-containing protein [Bacilli bacterium]
GWEDVKISSDRIESISEHIYGCLVLAISINSEYKLNLDFEKVLKILVIHELEEIIIPDYSALATITREEKKKMGHKAVEKVLDGLIARNELMNLIKEFDERKTKEAKFCYHIDKLEADFQAKMYDLAGYFDKKEAEEDCRKWNSNHAEEIIASSTSASDIWLSGDSYLYEDDETFKQLQAAIRDITKEEYDKIINDNEVE